MALFMQDIRSMAQLFAHMLEDIYYAEGKIEKALRRMIGKAGDGPLKESFTAHLEETRGHIQRLDRAFERLGMVPKAIPCPAIDGIIAEADGIIAEVGEQNVMDAALVAAAQAVEHYEIARYGTLLAWAGTIGRDDLAEIFSATLAEEKQADRRLTELAGSHLNQAA